MLTYKTFDLPSAAQHFQSPKMLAHYILLATLGLLTHAQDNTCGHQYPETQRSQGFILVANVTDPAKDIFDPPIIFQLQTIASPKRSIFHRKNVSTARTPTSFLPLMQLPAPPTQPSNQGGCRPPHSNKWTRHGRNSRSLLHGIRTPPSIIQVPISPEPCGPMSISALPVPFPSSFPST